MQASLVEASPLQTGNEGSETMPQDDQSALEHLIEENEGQNDMQETQNLEGTLFMDIDMDAAASAVQLLHGISVLPEPIN